MDLVGTGLSALGLGLIVYGILRAEPGVRPPQAGAPVWLGLSPVFWLVLGGGVVLLGFLSWGRRRGEHDEAVLIDPAMLDNKRLRGGLTSFFYLYLLQAGIFFAVPLFLSVALGLSAIATGLGCRSRSPCWWPRWACPGSSRGVPAAGGRIGFALLFLGLVALVAVLDIGVGPEVVTWPLLLAGLGIGDGVAARQRHRVGGPGRAERRGRRPAEHAPPGSLGGDRPGPVVLISGLVVVAGHRGRRRSQGPPRTPRSSSPAVCRSSRTVTWSARSPTPGSRGDGGRGRRGERGCPDRRPAGRAVRAGADLTPRAVPYSNRIPTRQPGADPGTSDAVEPAQPA